MIYNFNINANKSLSSSLHIAPYTFPYTGICLSFIFILVFFGLEFIATKWPTIYNRLRPYFYHTYSIRHIHRIHHCNAKKYELLYYILNWIYLNMHVPASAFLSIFNHHDTLHICLNICALLFICVSLEVVISWTRIWLIFILSGTSFNVLLTLTNSSILNDECAGASTGLSALSVYLVCYHIHRLPYTFTKLCRSKWVNMLFILLLHITACLFQCYRYLNRNNSLHPKITWDDDVLYESHIYGYVFGIIAYLSQSAQSIIQTST